MDMYARAARIRAANMERKEREKISRLSGRISLVGSGIIYSGITPMGKQATFVLDSGYSEQSRYAGTLTIDGVTMFTKGYMSKALEVMLKN